MQVKEGIFRDIIRLFIWFPFRWAVKVMPIGTSFFLFKFLGDLHFYAGRDKKRKVIENMKAISNGNLNSAKSSARQYFENHYLDRLHIFLYPKLKLRKNLERYVVPENIRFLEEGLRSHKGALLVQPHFGPVQITLLALSIWGYDPIQIGYPSDKGLSRIGRGVAFKYRLRYESMLPDILPADRFLGKAYKHLLKGGVVLTTGDGAGGGIFLGEHKTFKFVGIERPFPLGPATWALKTGSAFIPTLIIPEKYNKFRIVFEPPVEPIHNDFERDRVFMTVRFVEIMERYIKKYPYCWHFWDEVGKMENSFSE